MARFSVPDMSCESCIRSITGAVQAVDPAAEVRVDLASHIVEIRSGQPQAALAEAIDAAGFTAVPA